MAYGIQIVTCVHIIVAAIAPVLIRVPTPPGKSGKVLDFSSLKFHDLESPGKSLWSWKVLGKCP